MGDSFSLTTPTLILPEESSPLKQVISMWVLQGHRKTAPVWASLHRMKFLLGVCLCWVLQGLHFPSACIRLLQHVVLHEMQGGFVLHCDCPWAQIENMHHCGLPHWLKGNLCSRQATFCSSST